MKQELATPNNPFNLRRERLIGVSAGALFAFSVQALQNTVIHIIWMRNQLSWSGDFLYCGSPILCALALWFRVPGAVYLACILLVFSIVDSANSFISLPTRGAAANFGPTLFFYCSILAALVYVLLSSRAIVREAPVNAAGPPL